MLEITFDNLVEELPERVFFQYRGKPNAVAWYDIVPSIGRDLYDAMTDVRSSFDIDFATGELLDILGRIVGADRGLLISLPMIVTEFAVAAEAADAQFGDVTAQFSETSTDQDQGLSDDYFRKFIRWRIESNVNDATTDDIIKAIMIVMPLSFPRIDDLEDMSFTIDFLGPISDIDKLILDQKQVIPKPQGVRFAGYTSTTSLYLWTTNLSGVSAHGVLTPPVAEQAGTTTLTITLFYEGSATLQTMLEGTGLSLSVDDSGVIFYAGLSGVTLNGVAVTSGVDTMSAGFHTISGLMIGGTDLEFIGASDGPLTPFVGQIHTILMEL